MQSHRSSERGFTIIEMIVSLGVFSIVITIAVGALLMLIATNQQLQSEQSVMTNLSFALDSMTREIRTGTHYYCDSSGNINGIFASSYDLDTLGNSTRDCNAGRGGRIHGIAFNEGGNSITGASDRILYYYDEDDGKIYRRVGAGAPESIISTGIFIKDMYFYVSGSKPLSGGNPDHKDQASVTLYIEAVETEDTTSDPYFIQTTVTQRTLDL
jgi:prepilin-type N-terminal cleavage/methylation domain-containing protein